EERPAKARRLADRGSSQGGRRPSGSPLRPPPRRDSAFFRRSGDRPDRPELAQAAGAARRGVGNDQLPGRAARPLPGVAGEVRDRTMQAEDFVSWKSASPRVDEAPAVHGHAIPRGGDSAKEGARASRRSVTLDGEVNVMSAKRVLFGTDFSAA